MYEVRPLGTDELRETYHKYMRKDFPFREMRPLAAMEQMYKRGQYKAYGYYDEGSMAAYACFYSCKEIPYALMDYLAVVPDRRDGGIGSSFMRNIVPFVKQWEGIFIEAESVSSASDNTSRDERDRRIRFYMKNGAVMTGVNCALFGVDYSMLYIPVGANDGSQAFYDTVCDLYREMYGRVFGKMCRPYIPD